MEGKIMAGEYRIPVPKQIRDLVRAYAIKTGLTMPIVTQVLYSSNINVYNKDQVIEILLKYKRSLKKR